MFSREQDVILSEYREQIKFEELAELSRLGQARLLRPFWRPYFEAVSRLPLAEDIMFKSGSLRSDLSCEIVSVGCKEDLTKSEHRALDAVVQCLVPWRKGPFELFGHEIDAEWRSDRKWARIEPHPGAISGKRIADVGCGNGYYLFRLLGKAAQTSQTLECAIGFDPSERFLLTFELFQRYIQEPKLSYRLLGVEHLPLFEQFFDLVLCLGVIYHQRDPLSMLANLRESMRPGAKPILESQTIPGMEPLALFVPERYAKARNVYFLPTLNCLCALAQRAGFVNIKVVSDVLLEVSEQRQTRLAPYESLKDFLDPNDMHKTIEGYPAPRRGIIVCQKP